MVPKKKYKQHRDAKRNGREKKEEAKKALFI